jgi:streptogramin lyase
VSTGETTSPIAPIGHAISGIRAVAFSALVAVCLALAVPSPAGPPRAVFTSFGGSNVLRPQGIVAGPDHAIWFTNEASHAIGRITVGGKLRAYVNSRVQGATAIVDGPDGALWFLNGNGAIGRITTRGDVTVYSASNASLPDGLAVGPDGALWYTTGGKSIGRMTVEGVDTLFADAVRMRGTYGITRGPDDALWFSNYLGSSIGRITPDGVVSMYSDPRIRYPTGITTGPDGALWFADDSGAIGRITTEGRVTTFGSAATVGHPRAIAVGTDRALWATDRGGSIVRVTLDGRITRYRDKGIAYPVGITAGTARTIWFTNYLGNTVGRLELSSSALLARGTRSVIAIRSGSLIRLKTVVRLSDRASLTVNVHDQTTGRRLQLEPGSQLGSTRLSIRAAVMRFTSAQARDVLVAPIVSARALAPRHRYEVVVTAVTEGAWRQTLRLRFPA